MKRFYLLLFGVLLVQKFNAQPVITSAIAPEIGDQWTATFMEVNNFDPLLGGPNAIWDFSTLDTDNSFDINMKILAPDQINGGPNFPTADFVWLIEEFEVYNYYEKTDDSISLVGGASISNGQVDFLTTFLDPENGLQFPIESGDSYTYYSSFEQTVLGISLGTNNRIGMVVADGYGTLITPKGTYSDILRLVITETSFGFTSTQYAWFDVNNLIPVFLYETSDDPDTPPSIYFSEPNSTSTSAESIFDTLPIWHTWYSSADQAVIVEWPDLSQPIKAQVGVFSLDGKRIVSYEADFNFEKQQIPLPDLGELTTVIINLQIEGQQSSKKILVSR